MARILLVEDEPLIASLLIDWVEELGHEVVGPTGDGEQALEFAQAGVDLAFVDIGISRGDAYSLADELKRMLIPFTFATGYPTDAIEQRFRDVPSLGKPFDYGSFLTALTRMIARGNETARLQQHASWPEVPTTAG
jgi:CheY-like chemotaxis protein